MKKKRNGRRGLRLVAIRVLLLCLAGLAGCGGSDVSIGTVAGIVTLDGSPIRGATVIFSPNGGRPSSGETDDEGHYNLRYKAGVMGALIGSHKVRVATLQLNADGRVVREEEIPAKYNMKTSLTKEVKSGFNKINLELLTEEEP